MHPAPPRYNPPVRKLRRIVFKSLTVLSVLLCVAILGLWVRSYWRGDYIGRFAPQGTDATILLCAETYRGGVAVALLRNRLNPDPQTRLPYCWGVRIGERTLDFNPRIFAPVPKRSSI